MGWLRPVAFCLLGQVQPGGRIKIKLSRYNLLGRTSNLWVDHVKSESLKWISKSDYSEQAASVNFLSAIVRGDMIFRDSHRRRCSHQQIIQKQLQALQEG